MILLNSRQFLDVENKIPFDCAVQYFVLHVQLTHMNLSIFVKYAVMKNSHTPSKLRKRETYATLKNQRSEEYITRKINMLINTIAHLVEK